MNIQVRWLDNNHRIILHKFEPDWDWDDFIEASRLSGEMMDTVDHPVDVIADGRGIELPDQALSIMPKIREHSATLNHPRGGRYVIVGINRLIRTFVDVYMAAFSQHKEKIFFVDEYDEVYKLLGFSPGNVIEE